MTDTAPQTDLQLGLLYEIAAERHRQDLKWGEQNHPDGTGGEEATYLADALRAWCDESHGKGTGTWASILVEEVAEALAEADEDKLAVELLQSAAVAVGWVESIRRRQQRRENVA